MPCRLSLLLRPRRRAGEGKKVPRTLLLPTERRKEVGGTLRGKGGGGMIFPAIASLQRDFNRSVAG